MDHLVNTRILLWASLTLCLGVLTYLGLSQRQKDIVFTRLRIRGRRSSSADTPPRSLSPEKKEFPEQTPKAYEYVDTFPPSVRDALAELLNQYPPEQQEVVKSSDIDISKLSNNILAFEQEYHSAEPTRCTPTGVTVAEIKALGDFTNYGILSGIPAPQPYHNFDINKALPRPYRPFRWAYHQTMSLTKLEPDWWLELENSYVSRIAQRKALYAEDGEGVLQYLPGSELASKELMEISLQFLCARYPMYFSLSEDRITFTNKILDTTQNVKAKHPLLVLLDNVPEDFAIMLRNPETGYYHFRAGMICSALGWNLASKIGLRLHEIHSPVPDYREKMQFSMDRYFAKMPPNKPIQRGSWGLEVDKPLYMPPGDPHERYRDFQDSSLTDSQVHLRVDWQTLRRLPLSGAVVFNFKALFTPIEEFRDEPYVPALILKVLNEGNDRIMKYKNTWHVEHITKPLLKKFDEEQKESGLIEKGWQAHTLDDSPFFPGWEDKWHRQQGF